MAEAIFSDARWWTHSQYSYGYIYTSYDHSRSGSTQNYTVYYTIGISSPAKYNYGLILYMYTDGVANTLGTVPQNSGSGWTKEGNASVSIANKTSGSTEFYVRIYKYNNGQLGDLVWQSGTYYLTVDPANANITEHYIANVTENSVTVHWNADAACDYLQYSLQNGPWTDVSGYPEYTVSNLTPASNYVIKTRVRRADSQLWTETSNLSFNTYSYPYANSTSNFTIGENIRISLYNPLNRTVTIVIKGNDNSTICTALRNVNGSTDIGSSQAEIDAQYASIPNSNSGTYSVQVTYSGHTETASGSTYYTNINNCKPTFTNWTYEDVNSTTTALTGNNQTIIKGYSSVRGIITTANKATANKSATMKSYMLSIGSDSKSATYSSSSTVNVGNITPTTSSMTMYAIDSRNNSTGVTKNATTFINYSNIYIDKSKTSLSRTGAVGSETTLKLNGTFWNDSFGSVTNTIKALTIQYKLSNESAYTTITAGTVLVNENNFSLTQTLEGDLGSDGFSPEKSFNIRVAIQDELSSSEYIMILGPGEPQIAITRTGVAFGKPYDEQEGGPIQVVNGKVQIAEQVYYNSAGTNGTVSWNVGPSASEISYIEIYYYNTDDYVFNVIKIANPNNTRFNVNSVYYNPNDANYYFSSKVYSISGKNISIYQPQRVSYISYDSNGNYVSTNHVILYENIKIYKVVCYR